MNPLETKSVTFNLQDKGTVLTQQATVALGLTPGGLSVQNMSVIYYFSIIFKVSLTNSQVICIRPRHI